MDRSELAGLLALVVYFSVIAEWSCREVQIEVYCDNLQAVDFANDPHVGKTPPWADRRNVDLKKLLKQRLAISIACFKFIHVKGHQDDSVQYEALDLPAKMNYHCNLLAKTHAKELTSETNTMYSRHIPGLVASVENLKDMMTEGIVAHLYKKQYRGEVEELIGCTGRNFDWIDWGTLASVMRKTKWGPALRKLV